jgi:hypothetical protein
MDSRKLSRREASPPRVSRVAITPIPSTPYIRSRSRSAVWTTRLAAAFELHQLESSTHRLGPPCAPRPILRKILSYTKIETITPENTALSGECGLTTSSRGEAGCSSINLPIRLEQVGISSIGTIFGEAHTMHGGEVGTSTLRKGISKSADRKDDRL